MSVTTFAPDFGDDKAEPIDHSKKHPATSKGKSERYYNHSKCSAFFRTGYYFFFIWFCHEKSLRIVMSSNVKS